MAFTVTNTEGSGSSGNLDVANIDAGSLVAVFASWENSTSTTGLTSVAGDNGDSLTLLPATGSGNTSHQQWAYVLASNGGASVTYTITYPSGAVFPDPIALVATHDGTAALDVGDNEGTNTGTGTALTSGSVTTATTNELVLAGGNSYTAGSTTFSSHQINATNADGNHLGEQNQRSALWYRTVAAAFSNGTATATCSASDDWGCHLIAFKEGADGGTSIGGALNVHVRKAL